MKSVWAAGYKDEMNVSVAFRAAVPTGKFTLRVAASNTFRVFINGEFLAYGPMRTAHVYSNISEYEISIQAENCYIVAEVANYNINTYYIVKEEPFFACEVVSGGKVIADTYAFKGYLLTDRVKRVPKYSLQRPFAESYVMNESRAAFYMGGGNFPEVRIEKVVEGNKLLKCELMNPAFERIAVGKAVESGGVERDENAFVYDSPVFYDYPAEKFRGYRKGELECNLLEESCKLKYTAAAVGNGRYRLYELPLNLTGFVGLDITAHTNADIYILFDEIIYDEIKKDSNIGKYFQGADKPLIFWRGDTLNSVKWSLKAGVYKVMTFEPYTMKYLKVIVFGDALVAPSMTIYENSSQTLKFTLNDKTLQKIFDAAAATFRQNAVDVLTDCPSRERAGWLCDSYFTARAEKLFTGQNLVEKNMLTAILLSPQLSKLPKGMLPMCYPADHLNGNHIANWALWLIIELEDYLKRTGDGGMVAKFKNKIYGLLKYMAGLENADGLLERVEGWVFIEWSMANGFVQDVNYPSNMLYCGALKAAARLYGDKGLSEKAGRIKTEILLQSYNGEFFVDNAVRENGILKPTSNTTETCQYYAFYFGIADKNSHPTLYDTMFNVIKPNRSPNVYPALYKSNAFIGNFLRLDYLAREGKYVQVLDECVDYFAYMANRTGTLWEHDKPNASCNHGFASVAAEWIVNASKTGKN